MANTVSFIIELKNRFSKTSRQISNSFDKIKKSATETDQKLKTMFDGFQSRAKQFAGSAAKAGGVMTAAVTTPIVLMGKKMVDAASDAEETANKFKEVFKGIESQSALTELTGSYNLATSSAQELLSNTGDLLVGLGLSREQALKLSGDVVKLSADVASFKNVQGGTARASTALTKALLGEREMLKETFKTAVLEADVKERAMQLRRRDRKLTEKQAKALATLALVTERNKDAIGDLARTQDSYANVARRSEEASKQMTESFGKLLLPIAVKIQSTLGTVAEKLNGLSPEMKKIVLGVAAFAAIGGPLLLILGGMAAAFAAISLPVLGVAAALIGVGAAAAFVASRWDEMVSGAKLLWDDFLEYIKPATIAIAKTMELLFAPVTLLMDTIQNFKMPALPDVGGAVKTATSGIKSFFGFGDSAPVSGSVNGEIVVKAAPGAVVEKTKMTNTGSGLNMGMNMAIAQ